MHGTCRQYFCTLTIMHALVLLVSVLKLVVAVFVVVAEVIAAVFVARRLLCN